MNVKAIIGESLFELTFQSHFLFINYTLQLSVSDIFDFLFPSLNKKSLKKCFVI